jgi:predicted transcriptional regulator of viral defense system
MLKISAMVLKAIEDSPLGIASLDVLESLKLCDFNTLKTTLSRLNKAGKIIRLKRCVYSAKPLKDAFACAQATFNGYLGFSSALYLHKVITEMPYTIIVVTKDASATKNFGEYEFKAVALKEKAVGFEKKGAYIVSTRAKTLFDCIYLPKYSVEKQKLVEAVRQASLSNKEWEEFELYSKKFAGKRTIKRIKELKKILKR